MSRVREKQRIARTERILDAAHELFNDVGYDRTRIEDIAERAVVAPATVYNYYSTKSNIILALSDRHIEVTRPRRLKLLSNPPRNPVSAVVAYEKLIAEQFLEVLTKDCWRVISSSQFIDPGGAADKFAHRLNNMVRDDFRNLLEEYQKQDVLIGGTDVGLIADIIGAIMLRGIDLFLQSDATDPRAINQHVVPHTKLLLGGFLASR